MVIVKGDPGAWYDIRQVPANAKEGALKALLYDEEKPPFEFRDDELVSEIPKIWRVSSKATIEMEKDGRASCPSSTFKL